MNNDALILLGFLGGLAAPPVAWLLFRTVVLDVREGEAVLIRRFGRLIRVIAAPGPVVLLDRVMPWLHVDRVSRRLDFRQVEGIVSNDVRGTTVLADVWVELRVTDPVKARFAVENWDEALNNIVRHGVTSIFGRHSFEEIHADKRELAVRLKLEIADETARWGLLVEHVFLQRVSVLPEVAEQMFRTVAARLERAKADIEEEGHQRVAMLDAETTARTARMIAEAPRPIRVGRRSCIRGAPSSSRGVPCLRRALCLEPAQAPPDHGFPGLLETGAARSRRSHAGNRAELSTAYNHA